MAEETEEDLRVLIGKLKALRNERTSVAFEGRLSIENSLANSGDISGRALPLRITDHRGDLSITLERSYSDSPIPKGRRVYSVWSGRIRLALETDDNWKYVAINGGGGQIEAPVYNFQEGAKVIIAP